MWKREENKHRERKSNPFSNISGQSLFGYNNSKKVHEQNL